CESESRYTTSGFSTPCISMFMLPIRSIVLSNMEKTMMKVLPELRVTERFRMPLAQIFPNRNQKPTCTARWIADNIRWLRGNHLHHEANNVTWSSELPVLPRGGNLAKHVFVEIAFCVPVFHGHVIDQVDNFGEQ